MTSGTVTSNVIGIYNTKNVTITGGTVSGSTTGITSSGALILGTKGDLESDETTLKVSKDNPEIVSSTTGISTSGTFNFYDGIIKGSTAISGTVNEIEDGYEIIVSSDDTYNEIKYLYYLPIVSIDETEYYSFEEALKNTSCSSDSGCTMELLRNATVLSTASAVTISSAQNVTLDMKGLTITTGNNLLFSNVGTFKITDSAETSGSITTTSSGGKVIENSGTLTYEKITTSGGSTTIDNSGTMNILSGSIYTSGTKVINNTGTLTMSDGELKTNAGTMVMYNSGSTEITGGTISIVGVYRGRNYGIQNTGNGILKFSGEATINGASQEGDRTIIGIYNNATPKEGSTEANVQIDGGTISVAWYNYYSDIMGYGIQNESSTGVVTVNDGTISGGYAVINEGILNVNGGSMTGNCDSAVNNSNELNISGGQITMNKNTWTRGYGIENSGTIKMTSGTVTSNVIGIYNTKNATITGGTVSGSDTTISNSGTLTLSNITMDSGTIGINSTGGIVNIGDNTTINVTDKAVSSSGTLNIGSKDKIVSTTSPSLTGANNGVINSGTFNFYDGVVSGGTAISGTVTEVEPGYKIVTNKTDTLTSATLTLVGDDEKVAVLNGINFTSLQDAINSASDTNESIITLYKDVTFESNITVPANKNIKLYLNGYTLNKGSYDFTGEGKITVIDGTSTNALASIMESVKEVLNIEGIKKNIIIYEMDDGSAISSESTYKLYKDNEEVMLEEDAIGIYSVGNSNDEIRSANNKIYINELPKGKYKLIGDNNKEVKFEIDESGKIIGNVKENTKETRKLVSTAVAELIIMIQTGIEKVNYIMIILTLLVTISSLLYIVKKVNVKES